MKLNEVVSSNIKAYSYGDGDLIIQYQSGATYRYKDVPSQIVEDFKAADSKGKFVNAVIKKDYKCEKL